MSEIFVTDRGFLVVTPEWRSWEVSLDGVVSVAVYKVDELTTDLLCCDVEFDAEGDNRIITLHEDMVGFGTLMELFEELPRFRRNWTEIVLRTAFAESRTVLFQREERA